eukprot:12421217-Karenia_brevis.AAC.1
MPVLVMMLMVKMMMTMTVIMVVVWVMMMNMTPDRRSTPSKIHRRHRHHFTTPRAHASAHR